MRILNVSAQKPDSTGSGVYLAQTVRCQVTAGHDAAVICGIDASDECVLPAGARAFPVLFNTPELPFCVAGMSDQMPYAATRYRDFTPEMTRAFKQAFSARAAVALAEFRPDAVVCHHLYLATASVRAVVAAAAGVPVYAICHSTDLRQMRSHGLEHDFIVEQVRALDGVFALHEAQAEEIVTLYGIDPARVRVLGTGFDAGVFRREGRQETLPAAEVPVPVAAPPGQETPPAAEAPVPASAAVIEPAQRRDAASAAPAPASPAAFERLQSPVPPAPPRPQAQCPQAPPAPAARSPRPAPAMSRPAPAQAASPAPPPRPLGILYAGKIWEKKGVGCLLEACDRLDLDGRAATLTLAGGHNDEEEYARLSARARACRLPVELTGRLSPDELAERYRRADVFVLPSFYEGLPLVVVEALACGCRVVTSDLPGIRPWLSAAAPGAPVVYVRPPRMRGVDEPYPEDLPAFSARIACAIGEAAALPPCTCDLSALSWEGLTTRLVGML